MIDVYQSCANRRSERQSPQFDSGEDGLVEDEL